MPSLRFAFFLCIILLLGWRCHSDSPVFNQKPTDEQQIESKERLFYKANIPFVRLRTTPDNNAKIIRTLEKDALVEYMYDSTLFETQVTVGGNIYQSSWFYVRTVNNTLGWCQKILFNPLSYLENKELAQQIPIYDPDQIKESLSRSALKERQEVVDQSLIQRLENFISNLDPSELSEGERVIRFNQSYILAKSNKKTADVALMKSYEFISKIAKSIPQNTVSKYQSLRSDILSYGTYNTDQDAFCVLMHKNFVQFSVENNQVIASANLDQLLRIFYKELSQQMRKYIDLHTSIGLASGQNQNIDVSNVDKLLITSHQFIDDNQDFIYIKIAEQQHKDLLQKILQGSKNNQIFTKNNQLKISFKDLYISLSEQKEEKLVARIFKKLTSYYESNNWRATSDWVSYTEQTIDELMSQFKE